MRTPVRLALFLSLAVALSSALAQQPKPQQHPGSQAESSKSRKAFVKHEKAIQKKMDKQRKASLKQWNKAHPASHPPATDHRKEETHPSK